MNVVELDPSDRGSIASPRRERDEHVAMVVAPGSALYGLAEATLDHSTGGPDELSVEVSRAVLRGAVHLLLFGARLPRPVDLEAVGHPEAERDLVLDLRPRAIRTATVRFHHLGRPTPRIVLDDVIDHE